MSDSSLTTACPNAATLRALLDGILHDNELTATQTHVDRCSVCEAALRQMTAGGESWIGMAEKLKDSGDDDPKLAAVMNRIKTDDDSTGEPNERADPQRTLDFLEPTDDPKLLGKLGRHEISEVVGWGGMGVVLKAYDPSLHRVVAVKVLASHLAHHAVARKRFIREAQAAAAVCHDNVVTIHAIEDGVADASRIGLPTRDASATLPKIIMQFVAGGSLQERIDQDAPLELKEILRIAMQTAAGLAAAHAQGVVHRDVKPANILLENGVQRVKLTDFGLARVMDDASLTLSGVIAGTPQYMAPEQAWGRDVDARADLFSLGAVMYAMCSGHSPFRARTTMAVLKRVCEDPPRPLRAINPDVPDWLVTIIEKLLAKNPDERFQTATEVSDLLGRWLAHVQQPNVVGRPEPISARPDRARRGSPDPAASPDRRSPDWTRGADDKGDLRSNPSAGSGDSRTARDSRAAQTGVLLSAKVALLPMLGIGTALAIILLLIVAAGETNNFQSFVGFAAWNLLATFAICSVFRTAWNTSSWLIWIGSMLLLPIVGGQFVMASSYQPNPAAPQIIYAVQALTAFALLFGLLFVRPFFVGGSGNWMRERLTGWQRLFAIACFTIIGTPLTLAVMYLFSQKSSRPPTQPVSQSFKENVRLTPILPVDPNVDERPLRKQPFPKPQLLSNNDPNRPWRAGDVSPPVDGSEFAPSDSQFDTGSTDPTGGLTPPARQVQGNRTAVVADSLKPLQGRWVVLTLQGEEPPEALAQGGGSYGPPMAAAGATAVIPQRTNQLRFLEFRNGVLFLNDEPQRQMGVSIQNDRELQLSNSSGQSVRHGVFTIADDRLVICWTSGNYSLPRDFQPEPHHQLVVCRREWSRPTSVNVSENANADFVVKYDETAKLPKAEMPFSPREATALQAAWAEKSKSPVEVTNSVGMKLRVIPPGSFGDPRVATLAQSVGGAGFGFGGSSPGMMAGGGDASDTGGMGMESGPRSGGRGYAALNSAISGPILVGSHEVTISQFRQFIGDSKYVTEAERSESGLSTKPFSWRKPEIDQDSDQHPVVNVTFEDALAFCHWLSVKEKKAYRLLTRREWEFCARAGSWLPVTLGPGKLPYRSQFFTTTAPVGSYSANPFGLHDFIGNVAEWAWHGDIPAGNDSRRRPAPGSGKGIIGIDPKAVCGGDFRQHIIRSQPSEWLHPDATPAQPMTGFRVACDLSDASVIQLPAGWPTTLLMSTSQDIVRLRHLAETTADKPTDKKTEDNKDSDSKPREELRHVIWLELLLNTSWMPHAVEWLDFEVQRRTVQEGENKDEDHLWRVLNSDENWKTVPLEDAIRFLDQVDLATDDIVPPEFKDPVITMPIPKTLAGHWIPDPKSHWTAPANGSDLILKGPLASMPAFNRPRLLRFLDFNVPSGEHYFRVRLKYRISGITPEAIFSTAWFVDRVSVEIDPSRFDQPEPAEKYPVIELKPLPQRSESF